MGLDRRVVAALSVIALIAAPAAVLRALCAGHSCDEPDQGAANVPLCSLPEDRRSAIVAGFREGRSPDILTVTEEAPSAHVPVVFWGTGVSPAASIPHTTKLDAIAPTIAELIGLERPHPDVRSGTAVPGVADGERPGVVILVVVEGLGEGDMTERAWPRLHELATEGVSSQRVAIGSQPHDPAAIAATIGTGGLPYQHGITGTFLRNDAGKVVRAWGAGSPVSVIATLADDMDELGGQEPLIGSVAASESDRGLVGGDWYVENDRDVTRTQRSPAAAAEDVAALLKEGFGADPVPDLLAVSLVGRPEAVDRAIGGIARDTEAVRTGATLVVAGTGEVGGDNREVVDQIERSIEGPTRLIETPVAGGFFVDQAALAETGTTEDQVIDAVKETGAFADAFAAITVEFARYC